MIRTLLVVLLLTVSCTKEKKGPKGKTAMQEAVAASRTSSEMAQYNECKMHALDSGQDGSECEKMKEKFSERTLKKLEDNDL